MNNEKEIKEQMRDEFAFWFIENKDKPIIILNLETDESKSIKLEMLKEELGIDFDIEDIIYFHNSIDEIEIIINVDNNLCVIYIYL